MEAGGMAADAAAAGWATAALEARTSPSDAKRRLRARFMEIS
jgi:hypothetical protein